MKTRALLAAAAIVTSALAVEAQKPVPVGKLALSAPATVAELDMDKLKGQPAKLAWSPDGTELYLGVLDGPFGRPGTERHYVYAVAGGKQKSVDAPPAWAAAYWTRKSDRYSPDDRAFMLDVQTSQRVERATSAPMGGELARGGVGGGGDIGGGAGGTSVGDAIANAASAQGVTVNEIRLGGETVGEFVNSVIVPGLTFGWAPAGSKAIVYARPKSGELVVMDTSKKKQELAGTKDALLPAWSDDGTKLAWVRRDGRKKFSLIVANVSAR